ncbi:hypothetical protein JXA88_06700 [Candidatus Fermentibacteria bacterium]|nr:hypothetical protein [Candidatus Fermentibacteria bacterium]
MEWSWPPDSSVWAWGDTVPVARYDTLFWCRPDTPEVLGPDTCWFETREHAPDIFTLRAEIFGPQARAAVSREAYSWLTNGSDLARLS